MPRINPFNEIAVNRTLRHVVWGNAIVDEPERSGVLVDPSYCIALETLTLTANYSAIAELSVSNETNWPKQAGILGSPNLSKLIVADGVTELYVEGNVVYCAASVVELPASINKVGSRMFGLYKKSTIICKAITPPRISSGYNGMDVSVFYDSYNQMKSMTLYVPAESLELYKSTSGWSQFGTILPINI